MAEKVKDLTGYTTESGVTIIKRVENKNNKRRQKQLFP